MLEKVGNIEMLNTKQHKMFDWVIDYYLSRDTSQLLFHIDSVAGTCKSIYIIIILRHMVYHTTQSVGLIEFYNLVIWAASTGITIYNIQGCTLYLLLRLLINQLFINLSIGTLNKLQRQFYHVKLLVIDEKFMVSFNFLYQIDLRLRSIFARLD